MTTIKRHLTLLVLAMATACASAQPAVPQAAASASVQGAEVAVLRAQLETTKQFHDSYMTVTVSALGTAIAIVLALAAFSWFTNRSNYERDRTFLEEKIGTLKRELESLVQERSRKIQDELVTALDARQLVVQKSVETSMAGKLTALSAKVDEVKNSALELQIASQLAIAKRSVSEKMYDYAIAEYCELIRLHVERGSDFYMAGEIFDKIYEILKIPGVRMSSDNLTEAIGILDAPPKVHKHLSEPLVQRLKKLLL